MADTREPRQWPQLNAFLRAVTASDYSGVQRAVLWALLSHTSVKGELYVLNVTLAIESGTSLGTVSSSLSLFIKDGWVERWSGGSEGSMSHYRLHIPDKAPRTLKDNPLTGKKREELQNQNRTKQRTFREKKRNAAEEADGAEHPGDGSTNTQQEGVQHPGDRCTNTQEAGAEHPGGGTLNNPVNNPGTDPSTASAAEPPHAEQVEEKKPGTAESFQPPVPRLRTGPGRSRAWSDSHEKIAARAEGPPPSYRNVITLSRNDSRRTASSSSPGQEL